MGHLDATLAQALPEPDWSPVADGLALLGAETGASGLSEEYYKEKLARIARSLNEMVREYEGYFSDNLEMTRNAEERGFFIAQEVCESSEKVKNIVDSFFVQSENTIKKKLKSAGKGDPVFMYWTRKLAKKIQESKEKIDRSFFHFRKSADLLVAEQKEKREQDNPGTLYADAFESLGHKTRLTWDVIEGRLILVVQVLVSGSQARDPEALFALDRAAHDRVAQRAPQAVGHVALDYVSLDDLHA